MWELPQTKIPFPPNIKKNEDDDWQIVFLIMVGA
jgi:hypothetical protein